MRHRTHPSAGRTAGRASRYIRRKAERTENRLQWLKIATAYGLMLVAFVLYGDVL